MVIKAQRPIKEKASARAKRGSRKEGKKEKLTLKEANVLLIACLLPALRLLPNATMLLCLFSLNEFSKKNTVCVVLSTGKQQ